MDTTRAARELIGLKKILRFITIAIWVAYALMGLLCIVAGSAGAGLIFLLPAALSLIQLRQIKPPVVEAKPNPAASTPRAPSPTVHPVERSHVGRVGYTPTSNSEKSTVDAFIVLDIETTGLSPERDEIIEIGAIKVENGEITDRFLKFIKPTIPIPTQITQLTGIENRDVQNAPAIGDVIVDLDSFLGNELPVVGHNIGFDLSFIAPAFKRAGIDRIFRYIDTVRFAKEAFPGLDSYKLDSLISTLNLSNHDQAHRAMSDVEDTYALFLACRAALQSPSSEKVVIASEMEIKTFKPHTKYEHIRYSDIHANVAEIDPNGPLYGKSICFTGDLSVDRRTALQMAADAGAEVKNSISRKLDYLVVGVQNLAVVGEDGKSGKEEKAEALNSEGKAHIQIIGEAEFLAMVGSKG